MNTDGNWNVANSEIIHPLGAIPISEAAIAPNLVFSSETIVILQGQV